MLVCGAMEEERVIDGLERSIEIMGRHKTLLVCGFAAALIAASGMVAAISRHAASTARAQPIDDLSEVVDAATSGYRFSLIEYELSHLPNRWLSEIRGWFSEPSADEGETLGRWFSKRDDADRKAAELLLERRLDQASAMLGLDTPLPLFGRVRITWPPVDMDLAEPLHVLAVSSRGDVRLVRTALLTSDVPREAYVRIESTIEESGEWSAWVGRVGGVALYPASVVSSRGYLDTLQIMAHEWTHHYLGFYPLGLAYGRGSEMRTINETVADIVGDELGVTAAAIPGFAPPPESEQAERQRETRTLTDPILRQLRIDVDSLLADGRIDEAERLMAEVRLQLIELGRPFRRINQAFLAFRGGYGASPASASEWGVRLLEFRSNSPSLAEFLESVRGLGSADEADALLPR